MSSSDEFEELSSGTELDNSDWESAESPALKFRVVTLHDIAMTQKKLVDTVAETVGIPGDAALILLSKNKWRDELAISKVYDNPDYLQSLKIPEFLKVQRVSGIVDICPLCCEESLPGTNLGCGHSVCDECFAHYIQSRLEDRDVLDFSCPGDPQCTLSCTDEFLREYCSDYTYRYLLKILAEMFVTAHNDRYCGCPSPDCKFYVESFEPISASLLVSDCNESIVDTASKDAMVSCHCSGVFCFLCGESHLPVSCSCVKHWFSLSNEASLAWIREYTKPCPKCSARIEKNQGCDHMSCRCGYHFCWLCLSHFANYDHRCPRTSTDVGKGSASTVDINQRLLVYSPRFALQQSHQRFHHSMLSSQIKLNSDMDPLDEFFSQLPTGEGTALDAHRVLANSRGLVAWTYVLLLYVEESNDRHILEDLILDLQNASEALSSLVRFGSQTSTDTRLIKTRYIEQRSSVLLSHITSTNWKFIPAAMR